MDINHQFSNGRVIGLIFYWIYWTNFPETIKVYNTVNLRVFLNVLVRRTSISTFIQV